MILSEAVTDSGLIAQVGHRISRLAGGSWGRSVALLLVVRRARNVIDSQNQTIRERTQTLEILSARMLKSEESNKQKIAMELHEGLAQTLSAIKLYVENLRSAGREDPGSSQSVGAIIPVLHDAIEEVRAIATELRPSSIDDIGLLHTLDSHLRDVEQRRGDR